MELACIGLQLSFANNLISLRLNRSELADRNQLGSEIVVSLCHDSPHWTFAIVDSIASCYVFWLETANSLWQINELIPAIQWAYFCQSVRLGTLLFTNSPRVTRTFLVFIITLARPLVNFFSEVDRIKFIQTVLWVEIQKQQKNLDETRPSLTIPFLALITFFVFNSTSITPSPPWPARMSPSKDDSGGEWFATLYGGEGRGGAYFSH